MVLAPLVCLVITTAVHSLLYAVLCAHATELVYAPHFIHIFIFRPLKVFIREHARQSSARGAFAPDIVCCEMCDKRLGSRGIAGELAGRSNGAFVWGSSATGVRPFSRYCCLYCCMDNDWLKPRTVDPSVILPGTNAQCEGHASMPGVRII